MGPAFCRQFSMPFARRSGTLARCLSVYLALEAGKLLDGLNPNVPSLACIIRGKTWNRWGWGKCSKGAKTQEVSTPCNVPW